tara:strand:+ start:138 stop:356 length:219 start_codon:yes stop_codon:yes gene_type:complete
MNNNKQLTKGKTMKKIAMIIGVLSILATSANADMIWSSSNSLGGYNYFSTSQGMLGYSSSNSLGGMNFFTFN